MKIKAIVTLAVLLFSNILFANPKSLFPNFANPDVRNKNNFVEIKKGTFEMGSADSSEYYTDDEILHTVTISKDFEMQITAVTQAQYFWLMNKNPAKFILNTDCTADYIEAYGTTLCVNHPIESLSWDDANEYIKTLNATDAEYLYRLPTEAEWEYAARAGSTTKFTFGDDESELSKYAWFYDNSDRSTHEVGLLQANAWGLFDVHGNVMQMVSDFYGDYETQPQTDPQGALAGTEHVVRGGGWSSDGSCLRSAYRRSVDPTSFDDNYGFRLVRVRK